MAGLEVYLLGAPRLVRGGEPLDTGRRKATAVLAYLVLSQRIQRRESLAALFWPEHSHAAGRADLSRILSVLRKTTGDDWLIADRRSVGLAPETELWVDVLEFQRLLAAARSHMHPAGEACEACLTRLHAATAHYRGDFMAGLTLADSPEFDDWQALQTESLRQDLANALEKLALFEAQKGNYQMALKAAGRRLNLDPLHEPAQRQLMRLHAWSGDRSAAIRQYQTCRRVLDVELGLPPEEATRKLADAIQRGPLPPLPGASVGKSPAALDSAITEGAAEIRHNLPPHSTPFVGRQEELAQIGTLIREEPNCRLLTLVGPGGMGKTRLAQQAARQAVTAASNLFPNGVYFVSLAATNSPKALVRTIAETLGLTFYSGGGTPKEQLLNYLDRKAMLLVLDNLEQLLVSSATSAQEEIDEMADLLSALTKRAPQTKLLVTSRERLHLQGEWVFEVPGMAIPSSDAADEQTLATYSAVELFLGRARRARATFTLSEAESKDIIRICQLVGGAPLGIELAAAWVRMMSCQDIAREIEGGLDFLTTSLRDVPERHRSLRSVFEQSWSHLSPDEAGVFRKLSVFRGGFSLRAAQRVAGATMPILSALVDKSLLRQTRVGRFEIHELLRQFAAEKLAADDGESERAREQHTIYYAVFMQQRRSYFQGDRQQETLAEILADIDNVRAAWEWAAAHKNVAAIGRSLETFLQAHWHQGWFREGETAFKRAVSSVGGVKSPGDLQSEYLGKNEKTVLGKLLTGQGFFAARLGHHGSALDLAQQGVALLHQAGADLEQDLAYGLLLASIVQEIHGRYEEANRTIEEFQDLYRQIGDRWGVGTAQVRLGQVAKQQGRLGEAEKHLLVGIRTLEQVGDRKGLAYALDDLGHVVRTRGDYSRAQRHYEESLRKRQEAADQEGTILSLKNIGDMNRVSGRYAEAQKRYEECLTLAKEVGYTLKIADSLDGLGMVERLQGKYAGAEERHQESLILYRELGARRRVSRCLANLGRLAIDRGAFETAEKYLQESLALCQANGFDREKLQCLSYLGQLHLHFEGANSEKKVKRNSYAALKIAQETRSAPAALDILVGLAALHGQDGDSARAADLLRMVARHPGAEQETKDRAVRLLAETKKESSLAATTAAQDLTSELWTAVAQQLEELRQADQIS